jgi:hypothetical protein
MYGVHAYASKAVQLVAGRPTAPHWLAYESIEILAQLLLAIAVYKSITAHAAWAYRMNIRYSFETSIIHRRCVVHDRLRTARRRRVHGSATVYPSSSDGATHLFE